MAAEARRKCSANLQLSAPQEVQWVPQPRKAATTIYVLEESEKTMELITIGKG